MQQTLGDCKKLRMFHEVGERQFCLIRACTFRVATDNVQRRVNYSSAEKVRCAKS